MSDFQDDRTLLYDPMFAKKPPTGWEDSEKGGIFGKAKFKKTVFVVFLVIAIGLSLLLSFKALGKSKYSYTQTDNGYRLSEFNGSDKDRVLYVEYVIHEDGTVDETKPVASARNYAISCNEYIEYIIIGKDVSELEYNCFYYCTNLKAVLVDAENKHFVSVDGVLYNKDKSEIIIHPIKNHLYREALARGITVIQNTAALETFLSDYDTFDLDTYFEKQVAEEQNKRKEAYPDESETERNTAVNKAVFATGGTYSIPETVTSVAPFCFNYCHVLWDIKLPKGLKQIGQMSFFKCTGLESIYLPDGLEDIGADGLSYCEKLTYIYVPESVQTIGHHAFFGCLGCGAIYLGAKDKKQVKTGESWLPKVSTRNNKNVEAVYGQERRES